jgi:hypothetical protein
MSITEALLIFAGLYLILILVGLVVSHNAKRFLWELVVIGLLLALAGMLANAITGRVSFGSETSPGLVVMLMFVGSLLGIAARYIFYLRRKFSWIDFLKPLCISPIVLLPLIGSFQATKDLQPIQIFSFVLLAFQNGFFWQIVLERTRPQ